MIHQLKTKSEYFLDVATGKKPFEVRNNDRDYHVGDFLGLNELSDLPVNGDGEYKETGRFILAEVTYVLSDRDYVQDGYVILGIKPCSVTKGDLKAYQVFDELN